MADDRLRFGGGTPVYEAQLEKKRDAIRKGLKAEFYRKRWDPHSYEKGSHILDRSVQRYVATFFTKGEFFYPTVKNFVRYVTIIWVPIGGMGYLLYWDRAKREEKIRSGQVSYMERMNKFFV